MFSLSSSHRYYLYKEACDMRKGFNGLSGLVTGKMGKDPISGDVFIFINRRGTHIKLLHWESGGFVIYYKRLEKGTFSLPKGLHSGAVSWGQLVMMIEGIKAEKFGIYHGIILPNPLILLIKMQNNPCGKGENSVLLRYEKALETLSKQQLLALVKEQSQVHSKEMASHKKELQKTEEELKRSDEYLRKYVSKSGILEEKVAYLEGQLAMFRRMQFGQKRERFEDVDQLALPFEASEQELQKREEDFTEKITYQRKKKNTNHKGRQPLPDHLPVEEVEIYPMEDISGMKCIGKEVTDELDCEPARFFIRRYIRYKYAPKSGEGVFIGELPERVIDKGIAGAGLVTSILVDKYCDHLPLYRQRQRFKRENIPIAPSTINGWCAKGLERIVPLYEELIADVKSQGYLQVDETTIKVMDEAKKGKTHLGYYWVYHSPIDGNVVFDYQPTRGQKAPMHMLKDFRGYLQTDGYGVYDKYGKKEGVTHLACWAHARRYFDKARENDPQRAEHALRQIQRLYAIERKIKEADLSPQRTKEIRLEEALPVINELGKWMTQQLTYTLPKSQIGTALAYSVSRWDALCAYLYDGNLLIDNNLIENKIRPVTLGRKNYLFAGSHQAAQRAAAIYSFFAICKKHEVNPYQWLKYTLENIMTIKYKNIKDLYPQNFKKLLESNQA